MSINLRFLGEADIPLVDPILKAAYKRTACFVPRLLRYLALEPRGWILAEAEARPVGMGGIVAMGGTAYVGLVAVSPDHQGRGIGRAVVTRLIDLAREKACARILLDASPAGRPLYEGFGFRAVDGIGVWTREAWTGWKTKPAPEITSLAQDGGLMAGLLDFDARAWGDDRGRVLRAYCGDDPSLVGVAWDGAGTVKGYAVLQREAGILGPWLAADPGVAGRLLDWALEAGGTAALTAYMPEANPAGQALLSAAGFSLSRSNTHMELGPPMPEGRRRLLYSQASLALG